MTWGPSVASILELPIEVVFLLNAVLNIEFFDGQIVLKLFPLTRRDLRWTLLDWPSRPVDLDVAHPQVF